MVFESLLLFFFIVVPLSLTHKLRMIVQYGIYSSLKQRTLKPYFLLNV
jgi:hypothetical protein